MRTTVTKLLSAYPYPLTIKYSIISLVFSLYLYKISSTPESFFGIVIGLLSISFALYGLESTTNQLNDTQRQLSDTQVKLKDIQIDYWNAKGVNQHKQRDESSAIQFYMKSINIDPQMANTDSRYAKVWLNMANSLSDLGLHNDAYDALKKADKLALRSDKISAKILSTIGITLCSLHKYDMAIDALETALWINPELAGAWGNLGAVFFEEHQYDDALKAAEKAIELDSKDTRFWSNKGNALNHKGKYDESIKAFDTAIELKPNYADVWYNKGIALNAQKRYAEAIHAYNKAIEFNPLNQNAWNNKGKVLAEQGIYGKAIQAYDRAIDINPCDALAWANKSNALAHLCSSHVKVNDFRQAFESFYKAEEAYNKATKLYDEHIPHDSNDAVIWQMKGEILYILGRFDDAAKAYDNAIRLDPYNALLRRNKGDALNALGLVAEAGGNTVKAEDFKTEAISAIDKANRLDLLADPSSLSVLPSYFEIKPRNE